ncbi:MAG: peroxiredoxin [Thermoplasmata archaeon]
MKDKVEIGDKAPEFALKNQNGETVSLKDFLGKKAVVLYFYPKDMSPGCTKEACAFRDSYEAFKDAGAEVIGISSQSQESHSIFSLRYNLPFTLLVDEGSKVRRLYGVRSSLGMIPGRVTYVIDKEGVVRHIFSSQVDIEGHVNEALTVLKTLTS